MSPCLCEQHENQFVEYYCLDNKCKQKLHCNKCVKYFAKDHSLMDLKRVQQSLLRLSVKDKVVTSRNFELADHDLVQLIEGMDPKEKQEQYIKSLMKEREEVRKKCMEDIQQSMEQLMKESQRCIMELQVSMQKCYSRKIDDLMSVAQLNNQTFKHKALLHLHQQFNNNNNSEYTQLNDSLIKLHSGQYELMYAKQLNQQIFFDMQQKISSFIKSTNAMINNFCGSFMSLYQQTLDQAHLHLSSRQTLSKSGQIIKYSHPSSQPTKLPPTHHLSTSSALKNQINSLGPQNKFFSQNLKSLNQLSQQHNFQSGSLVMPKVSGARRIESTQKGRYQQDTFSMSMVLPTNLTPDNINHTKTYQIRSIGNLETTSEFLKDIETPFKTNNYLTQTQKTLKVFSFLYSFIHSYLFQVTFSYMLSFTKLEIFLIYKEYNDWIVLKIISGYIYRLFNKIKLYQIYCYNYFSQLI